VAGAALGDAVAEGGGGEGVTLPERLAEAEPVPLPLCDALAVTEALEEAVGVPEPVMGALAVTEALPVLVPVGEMGLTDGVPVAVSVELPVPEAGGVVGDAVWLLLRLGGGTYV
jgi:hypothetical protein